MTGLPSEIHERAEVLHSDLDRGYHDWSHPLALLALLDEVCGQLHDALAVEAAILFHDAVYEPRATDNEARSADLARELLAGRLPADTLGRAIRLIEATARHRVPNGIDAPEAADMRVFLDMDLSILGADAARFDAYEAGVRHEYRDIPDDQFRAGRARILSGFLDRERLFLSDWGRDRFEAAARRNLQRSIAALEAGG